MPSSANTNCPPTHPGCPSSGSSQPSNSGGGSLGGSGGSGSGEDFSAYSDFWENEWYGWWIMDNTTGVFEELEGSYYDVCGAIYFDEGSQDTGYVYLWDETGDIDDPLCVVDVTFGPGESSAGCMTSKEGFFLSQDVQEGDWVSDPAADGLTRFDHLIVITGHYEYEEGGLDYAIYMKPWGMDWEDVRSYSEDMMPYLYDSWYSEAMYGVMPDSMPKE